MDFERGRMTLGRWQLKIGVDRIYEGYVMFHFGIFKMTSFPKEGELVMPRHYDGFWLRRVTRGFGLDINF